MRHVRNLLFTFLLGIFGLLSFTTNASAQSANSAMTVPVSQTSDLGIASSGTGVKRDVSNDFTLTTVKNSYLWKFTLPQAAFVKISSCADIYEFNFNGDASLFLGVNETCPDKCISGWADGTTYSYTTLLEAGTYYLRQDIDQEDVENERYFKKEKSVSVKVETQAVPQRTGGKSGLSKDTAIPVSNGISSYGIISGDATGSLFPANSITNQYFRIDVGGKTKLTYTLVYNRPSGEDNYFKKGFRIQNNLGVNLLEDNWGYGKNSFTGTIDLPCAGTYYIQAFGQSHASIGVTLAWNNVKVSTSDLKKITCKVNRVKRNKKKVTGKVTKGATVKVYVGKKCYRAKVYKNGKFVAKTKKLKKGKKIKVKAMKSGYRTKTITVKIK